MSRKDYLSVRFHFDGKFLNDGRTLQYVGGEDAMSMILRERCRISEIHRHLRLHHDILDREMLHWLMPGKGLSDGLGSLVSDEACMVMIKHIPIDVVVNIYVEKPGEQPVQPNKRTDDGFIQNEVQGGDNGIPFPEPDCDNEVRLIGNIAGMPSTLDGARKKLPVHRATSRTIEVNFDVSSDDSDYAPDDDSSDDDEAANIHESYMQFKASVKAGKAPISDCDLKFSDAPEKIEGNSSDDDESLDEDSEGELVVKESKYARFDRNVVVPYFQLGMKFSSKQEFKQAIINYGLHERKEMKFLKDEGDRVTAVCSWPLCPWVCLLKKTSRFQSWQVTSYKGDHICPMRRDSKLVTATRIADRFQKLIMANPQWSIAHLQ